MDRDHHHHLEPGSARHLGRSASDGGRGEGFAMTGIFLHSSGAQILRQFFSLPLLLRMQRLPLDLNDVDTRRARLEEIFAEL